MEIRYYFLLSIVHKSLYTSVFVLCTFSFIEALYRYALCKIETYTDNKLVAILGLVKCQ